MAAKLSCTSDDTDYNSDTILDTLSDDYNDYVAGEYSLVVDEDNVSSLDDESTMKGLESIGSDNIKPSDKHESSVDFVLEADVEIALQEKSLSDESSGAILDRYSYLRKFLTKIRDYGNAKRLNNFLHKKMADYFKKRKMDHVLVEVDHPEDTQLKYYTKLDTFKMLRELTIQQRTEITEEIRTMKEMRSMQCFEADNNFKHLLQREADVGNGLISAKTGKEVPDKVVEKLISNQINKAKELQDLRLMNIKIRNAVADLTASIRQLDCIGQDNTLVEYEQLKIENQGFIDKLEEREDELSRLRKKCRETIQLLAHIREKCSASEQNIRRMKQLLVRREIEKMDAREEMNRLKQERDWHRLETQRLKEENGLLTKDKLLIDMENAINAVNTLLEHNRTKREKLLRDRERLQNVKKHYDREVRKSIAKKRSRDGTRKKKPLHSDYAEKRVSKMEPFLENKKA